MHTMSCSIIAMACLIGLGIPSDNWHLSGVQVEDIFDRALNEHSFTFTDWLCRLPLRYELLGVILDTWTTLASRVVCFRILQASSQTERGISVYGRCNPLADMGLRPVGCSHPMKIWDGAILHHDVFSMSGS